MEELKGLMRQLIIREDKLRLWIKAAVAACILVFLMTIALQYQITKRNTHIDAVSQSVEDLEIAVGHIEDVQTDIQSVAKDVAEVTPEEEAQNEAVATVLRQVPQIKGILCEAFPLSSPCQEP